MKINLLINGHGTHILAYPNIAWTHNNSSLKNICDKTVMQLMSCHSAL